MLTVSATLALDAVRRAFLAVGMECPWSAGSLAVTGGAQATCLSDAGNEDFFVRCPKN